MQEREHNNRTGSRNQMVKLSPISSISSPKPPHTTHQQHPPSEPRQAARQVPPLRQPTEPAWFEVELSKAKHATPSGRHLNPARSTPCDPKKRPATTHTRPKRHSASRALDSCLSNVQLKHFSRRREVSPNPTHTIAIVCARCLQTPHTTSPTAFWPHRIDQR
jgi:hypothetical protein